MLVDWVLGKVLVILRLVWASWTYGRLETGIPHFNLAWAGFVNFKGLVLTAFGVIWVEMTWYG